MSTEEVECFAGVGSSGSQGGRAPALRGSIRALCWPYFDTK